MQTGLADDVIVSAPDVPLTIVPTVQHDES
jgi:hypothetical protein